MSKRVLDTEILSGILKGKDPTVAERARAYRQQQGRYTFTVVSVLEIVRGLRKAGAEGRLRVFLSSLAFDEVLPFDTDSAVLAGEIDSSSFQQNLRQVGYHHHHHHVQSQDTSNSNVDKATPAVPSDPNLGTTVNVTA